MFSRCAVRLRQARRERSAQPGTRAQSERAFGAGAPTDYSSSPATVNPTVLGRPSGPTAFTRAKRRRPELDALSVEPAVNTAPAARPSVVAVPLKSRPRLAGGASSPA